MGSSNLYALASAFFSASNVNNKGGVVGGIGNGNSETEYYVTNATNQFPLHSEKEWDERVDPLYTTVASLFCLLSFATSALTCAAIYYRKIHLKSKFHGELNVSTAGILLSTVFYHILSETQSKLLFVMQHFGIAPEHTLRISYTLLFCGYASVLCFEFFLHSSLHTTSFSFSDALHGARTRAAANVDAVEVRWQEEDGKKEMKEARKSKSKSKSKRKKWNRISKTDIAYHSSSSDCDKYAEGKKNGKETHFIELQEMGGGGLSAAQRRVNGVSIKNSHESRQEEEESVEFTRIPLDSSLSHFSSATNTLLGNDASANSTVTSSASSSYLSPPSSSSFSSTLGQRQNKNEGDCLEETKKEREKKMQDQKQKFPRIELSMHVVLFCSLCFHSLASGIGTSFHRTSTLTILLLTLSYLIDKSTDSIIVANGLVHLGVGKTLYFACSFLFAFMTPLGLALGTYIRIRVPTVELESATMAVLGMTQMYVGGILLQTSLDTMATELRPTHFTFRKFTLFCFFYFIIAFTTYTK